MNSDKPNPTLEEIASRSGVSIATVSRVINASGPVSKEVEERVRQIIDELGFEPRRKRTRPRTQPPVIACITPEFLNPANAQIITSIQEEAEKSACHLLILPVREKSDSQHYNLNLLKNVALDGVILHHLGVTPEDVFEVCNRSDLPLVMLRRDGDAPHIHCIDTDRENGMYQATRLLLGLNHRRIAYLAGSFESQFSQAKLRGIQRALAEADLTLESAFHLACLPTIDDGFRAAHQLLSRAQEQRPTAILAYNDLVAIGALHAIRAEGLTIPGDISVIGFDNIYLTSHTNPPLTTVAQPHYQQGQLAIQKLLSHLNGHDSGQGGFTLLECALVVRESSGPYKP
jgi:DNA-binding LacI/PurR family transcriptional regulator